METRRLARAQVTPGAPAARHASQGHARDRENHRVVVIEALRVKAMTSSARGTAEDPGRNIRRKAGLNQEILDRGWSEFRRQLGYKLAWAGGRLIEVSARDTSRLAACVHVDARSRVTPDLFRCVACGHEDEADRNTAIEIRRRGLAVLDLRDPAGTVGAARGLKGIQSFSSYDGLRIEHLT